jgi:hypothetical protein
MLPKSGSGRGYASKIPFLLHYLLTMKPGKKPVTGPFMRQEEGQEFRQTTPTMSGDVWHYRRLQETPANSAAASSKVRYWCTYTSSHCTVLIMNERDDTDQLVVFATSGMASGLSPSFEEEGSSQHERTPLVDVRLLPSIEP